MFPTRQPDSSGHSSTPGGHVSLIQKIRAALRKRRDRQAKQGNAGQAKKAQQALNDLKNAPKPTPTPAVPTAPHGFMPGAVVQNIPPGANDPAIEPCGTIWHIAVSDAPSLFGLFSNDGGIESHFYVRKDGTFDQYRSIFFEADAQFDGNSFGSPRKGFVSIEFQGGVPNGEGTWTDQQVATGKAITLWVKSQSDFPLRVPPAWDQPGVGYHALFEQWNLNHHSCPGASRITQFHNVIVPWLKAGGK